jgi:hypothetical protein
MSSSPGCECFLSYLGPEREVTLNSTNDTSFPVHFFSNKQGQPIKGHQYSSSEGAKTTPGLGTEFKVPLA